MSPFSRYYKVHKYQWVHTNSSLDEIGKLYKFIKCSYFRYVHIIVLDIYLYVGATVWVYFLHVKITHVDCCKASEYYKPLYFLNRDTIERDIYQLQVKIFDAKLQENIPIIKGDLLFCTIWVIEFSLKMKLK